MNPQGPAGSILPSPCFTQCSSLQPMGRRGSAPSKGGFIPCHLLRAHHLLQIPSAPPAPSRPVHSALALCSQWCQVSGEPMTRPSVPKQRWGLVFHRTNCSKEGKKPKQIENSEINVPCPQSCVDMCFRKEGTPFLVKPIPKHITSCCSLLCCAFPGTSGCDAAANHLLPHYHFSNLPHTREVFKISHYLLLQTLNSFSPQGLSLV